MTTHLVKVKLSYETPIFYEINYRITNVFDIGGGTGLGSHGRILWKGDRSKAGLGQTEGYAHSIHGADRLLRLHQPGKIRAPIESWLKVLRPIITKSRIDPVGTDD